MDAQSTAYLFTFLGMMLNASALGVSWHLARPMPGGGAWFAGASLVFLGFLPLIVNLTTPWLPLVSMHNLAVAVGQAIVVGGIFTYFGKTPPWRVLGGLVGGFMLLHSWYLYVDYDVARRTVLASVSLALVNGIGAWQLSVAPWVGIRTGRLYAVIAWWALVLVLVLRGLMSWLAIGTQTATVPDFEANFTYLLVFIFSPVTITAAALGLILMTVRRLADERESALNEARRLALHFEQLASYDALTGAYNRRSFMTRASEELSRCRRNAQPCCLLMIDLDLFKRVNDTYGHASGDEALRQLARIVRLTLRDFDIFGRIGGEEFAALLCSVDSKQAADIGNRLREAMSAETITHETNQFRITLSGGVVMATDKDSVESLLEAADAALYRAKNAGRNRIEVATDECRPSLIPDVATSTGS
jgi:diguanylate cyclase (GGDEF)-like protein